MQAFTNAASFQLYIPDRPSLPGITAAMSAGDRLARGGEFDKAETAYWAGFDERNLCKTDSEFTIPRTENRIDYGDSDDRVATADLLIALGDLYIRQNLYVESAACYAKAKRFDSSYTFAWEQHMRADMMAEENGVPFTPEQEMATWSALAHTAAHLKIEKLILPETATEELAVKDAEMLPEIDNAGFDMPYIPPAIPAGPAYAAA